MLKSGNIHSKMSLQFALSKTFNLDNFIIDELLVF